MIDGSCACHVYVVILTIYCSFDVEFGMRTCIDWLCCISVDCWWSPKTMQNGQKSDGATITNGETNNNQV